MNPGIGPAGKIARFFIESKLTPLIVLGSLVLGAFAVILTPREEEPQIVVPMVDIFVALPGADPQEVENRVTLPLERRLWEIPGVEYVYATSMPGVAMVSARFLVGADLERSLVKLYDKLAGGMDRMPPGASPPLIKRRSIDDVPVLALTLWSRQYDWFELRRVAAQLRGEISEIANISDVKIIGGQKRQIGVMLDAERMTAFGVDAGQVAAALRMQNATQPAGAYEELDREVLVETGAFLQHADEVRDLVVGVHQGKPVYLRDVAEIRDGAAEAVDYVLFARGPAAVETSSALGDTSPAPAVTLSIAKRRGSDAERVVRAVMNEVEQLQGRLIPPAIEVSVTRDYGETSSEKARELLTHLIGAIISVTIVIAIFLGWRGALVVFVSVPVTFALTLFVYYVFGYTLNRVTLFALIFVTGIVVDDSIIVVENIVRHFQMRRLPPLQAAITAVAEVGNPTILATLTVIAAVLPMAFVRGLMGPYMRPMPVGATMAMIFSLLIALVAAPWFAYRLVKTAGHAIEESYSADETRAYRVYRALLVPLLQRPLRGWLFLGGVTLLLLLSVAMFPLKIVQVKMLPFDNKSEVQVIIDMPEGTTLERTAGVAREIGAYLQTVDEVTDLQIYAGTSAPVNFNGLVRHYDLRHGSHVADLQVNLAHKSERSERSHAFAKRIRPPIQEIAARHGAAVKVAEIPPGPPVLATLVSEIYGPTREARVELARKVLEIYETTDGVVDTDWLVEAPQPKQILRVDREKAALLSVPAAEVVRLLRLALDGESAGLLHDDSEAEPVSIELRLPRAERSSLAELERIRVASMSGALIPLSELVRVEPSTLSPSRHRKNLRPVVYVTGDVAGAMESPVYALMAMGQRIDQIEIPGDAGVTQYWSGEPATEEQVSMKWDGEWQITYEVFRDLGLAFGAVMILIYGLIIGWFQSFKVPLVMMIAIPLSLVGILPGHWIFGAFFTATSMIGFIALAGIMVRNSVLLIDFVDQTLERGTTLGEAVVEAGAVRFRPILLTAGTVVVGALVILFDPIFEGLAISLLFGAIASTILTLLVVPLVYYMVEKRRFEEPLPAAWQTEKAAED